MTDLPSTTPEDPNWAEKSKTFIGDWLQRGKEKVADLTDKAHQTLQNMMTLRVKKLTPTAKIPSKRVQDGYDIYIDTIEFNDNTFSKVNIRPSFDKNDIPPETLFRIRCGVELGYPTNFYGNVYELTDDGLLISLDKDSSELILNCFMVSRECNIQLSQGDKIGTLELKPMSNFPVVECS